MSLDSTPSVAAPVTVIRWQQRLVQSRHRGLVHLSGTPSLTRRRAQALIRALAPGDALWVGAPEEVARDEAMPASVTWLAMPKARGRLGGEQGMVVFDAHGGFDPDAFGALAGTVRAGGLMLLLTPDDWGRAPDADYGRLADYPAAWQTLTAHYLARLSRLLELSSPPHWRPEDRDGPVWLTEDGGHADSPAGSVAVVAEKAYAEETREEGAKAPCDEDCLTPDQARAASAVAALKRRRPLVITADRGRGKSAALGIGAARRLAAGDEEVLVTAPRQASVAALFERLAALLPEGRRQGGAFVWGARAVRFIPPDRLMQEATTLGGAGRVLLVDEAAALPVALLARALRHFPRVVFATTVHGYEGSGRGFALRFRARLERLTPQWRALTLETPVRWAPGDPLERLTASLLALRAEPPLLPSAPDGPSLPTSEPAPVYHHRLDRAALARDEARLQALFGLLVQAHYRTSPADLRTLLDGPGVGIETLEMAAQPGAGALLAVAVTVDEGGFDPALAERVARGERRPRGHLVAQSLALHEGIEAAAVQRQRRLMRLAVHPEARRQGLGTELVARVAADARCTGLDLLTASFGAEPGLIAFWRSGGFDTLRAGVTPETSTGEYPLMVGKALNETGQTLLTTLQRRFNETLPALLALELRALEPAVAAALLAELSIEAPACDERRALERFAHARAPLTAVRPALRRRVIAELQRRAPGTGTPAMSAARCEALAHWAALLWQGREAAWLAERLAVAGRAALYDRLRAEVAQWLSAG